MRSTRSHGPSWQNISSPGSTGENCTCPSQVLIRWITFTAPVRMSTVNSTLSKCLPNVCDKLAAGPFGPSTSADAPSNNVSSALTENPAPGHHLAGRSATFRGTPPRTSTTHAALSAM